MSITKDEQAQEICKNLPLELSSSKHKGEAGRIGIIGGSEIYTGAPYFAATTALRCGADLAYVFCTKAAAIPIKCYSPELIVLPYLDSEYSFEKLTHGIQNLHTLIIGPGLGIDSNIQALIVDVIEYIKQDPHLSKNISLVFDADAISIIAQNTEIFKNHSGPVFITPNANEIRRLASKVLKTEMESLNETSLMNIAQGIGESTTLIVKGSEDRIITNDSSFVCSIPGSNRRCGGQGDFISGALGLFSYWSRHMKCENTLSPKIVACYAACALTRICNRFAFFKNGRSMVATDMIGEIGEAYQYLFRRNT